MEEEFYLLGNLYLFDSVVIQVGLYLTAMFIAIKVGIVLLSHVKSFLWPF